MAKLFYKFDWPVAVGAFAFFCAFVCLAYGVQSCDRKAPAKPPNVSNFTMTELRVDMDCDQEEDEVGLVCNPHWDMDRSFYCVPIVNSDDEIERFVCRELKR